MLIMRDNVYKVNKDTDLMLAGTLQTVRDITIETKFQVGGPVTLVTTKGPNRFGPDSRTITEGTYFYELVENGTLELQKVGAFDADLVQRLLAQMVHKSYDGSGNLVEHDVLDFTTTPWTQTIYDPQTGEVARQYPVDRAGKEIENA